MGKCCELKTSAANFGFDATWIADILERWGGDVVTLAIEAARNGLTVTWIVEALDKFGPSMLEFVVGLLNKWKMQAPVVGFAAGESVVIPGPIVEGMDSAFVDTIVEKYLPLVIEKYLPLLLDKFGPQLIQLLTNLLFKNLQK